MFFQLFFRSIVLSLAGIFAAIPLSYAAGTNWFGGIDVANKFWAKNSQNFSGSVDDKMKSRKIYGAFDAANLVEQEVFPGEHSFWGRRGIPFLARHLNV